MGQAGRFLRRVGAADGHTAGGYAHYCPGCKHMHAFAVDAPFSNGARWTFDGNLDKPTFTPSMNIGPDDERCHYNLTAGNLTFHNDTKHSLKGQTVPLPELPEGLRDA